MTKLYQAEIDGQHLLDISGADLDGLDQHQLSEQFYHVLSNHLGYEVEVVTADYDNKEFVLKVKGRKVHVLLRDPVEVQVHDMGLDVLPAARASDINAPMPGLVLSVHVKEGDEVQEGDKLVILEAMKMENVLSAHSEGTVSGVHVEAGQPVEKGQILVSME